MLGVGVARVRASGPRMLAWITYGGPDCVGALGLEGGALFSFFYSEVRMQGNNRVKVATYLHSQCTAGTRNKCSREQGFTREQARMHKGLGSPPILKRTTHPSRSPLRQAEVVHTANLLTSIDWYYIGPSIEQAPSSWDERGHAS
eukprot:scaffold18104_cov114-Isochrysis_galbana.AAC.1